MSWQTEKIRGKWRPFELSQQLLWSSSGPIKIQSNGWWDRDFCAAGAGGGTSVYRLAHQDNDYVIAIVGGTQRPNRELMWMGRRMKVALLKFWKEKRYRFRYKGPDTLHCSPWYQWLTSMGAWQDNAWDPIAGNDLDRIRSADPSPETFSSQPPLFEQKMNFWKKSNSRGSLFGWKVLKSRDHSRCRGLSLTLIGFE